jgi:hypothetical protein
MIGHATVFVAALAGGVVGALGLPAQTAWEGSPAPIVSSRTPGETLGSPVAGGIRCFTISVEYPDRDLNRLTDCLPPHRRDPDLRLARRLARTLARGARNRSPNRLTRQTHFQGRRSVERTSARRSGNRRSAH